jgi:hypothetical protein
LRLALIGAVFSIGCGASAPPFKPVADVKQLMNDVVEPSAESVWAASGTILSAKGIESRVPTTDAQWTAVRHNAVAVAEAGNLLMMAPRARDTGVWMNMARAMVEKGEAAVRAADLRDGQRMFDTGGELYETCLNCHQQYMPAIRNALKANGSQQ